MKPLSSRAQRPTLLIVGCGDVGLRVLKQLAGRWRVLALTSSPERMPALRLAGAVPLLGNLDQPDTLRRLAGLADAALHLAPPPNAGRFDPRTRALVEALARRGRLRRLVYGSTSGVYGDCLGDFIDETRRVNPQTDRGARRVDAERRLRWAGLAHGWRVSLLRIPGIYAPDREGGRPRDRVARGSPVLREEDDVYTNHIHADDLARACIRALTHALPQRAYHISDDSDKKMGHHFDEVADRYGLPRPPRISREEMRSVLSPVQQSFMSESRRLSNQRLKQELGLMLRYPTVAAGLAGEPFGV
jgi:nucleoside-diphosphate-sugar epimerase